MMKFVRPWKRLLAFQRVTLAQGASTTVHVPLTRDELGTHQFRTQFRKIALVLFRRPRRGGLASLLWCVWCGADVQSSTTTTWCGG